MWSGDWMWAVSGADSHSAGAREEIRRSVLGAEPAHLRARGGAVGELEKMGVRGASLVAQWLRIRLPMQGTRVRPLVREDPTCRGATNPVHHNY